MCGIVRLPVLIVSAVLLLGAGGAEDWYGFDVEGATVPRDSIVAGGPGRDGIRSVDEPEFAPVEEARSVRPDTPVLGVEIGGKARAYPVHLLEWHQIVNDTLGGEPIAVTYDPLAGSSFVFRRTLDGRKLSFGVSGLVYNSNFLLYDRETESLWSQFQGKAIAGPLAGKTLSRVRVRQETTASWVSRFPDSKILKRPVRRHIDYRYSPFRAYWTQDAIPFPVNARDRRYHAKEVVVGVVVGKKARAYLGSIVTREGGSVEDEFEGEQIRVVYDSASATFSWNVPDDVMLVECYWFAWKAFYPETDIWNDALPPEK